MRTPITLAALAVAIATPLAAQTAGRADLRYVADTPVSLSYATEEVDGGVTMRSRLEMQLTPTDSGLLARFTTHERTSSSGRTPRVPPPSEQILSARGPAIDRLSDNEMDNIFGAGVLLILPGRVVQQGESWADTLRLAGPPALGGSDMHMVVHGSYERDTVVDGRTLNVLRIRTNMTGEWTLSPVPDVRVTSTVSAGLDELVLWDSARHVMVVRDGEHRMEMHIRMPDGIENRDSRTGSQTVRLVEPAG
jgi:hypothetical protein